MTDRAPLRKVAPMHEHVAPTAVQLIGAAGVVIWDFDGVIKESVQVKTDAFAKLFGPFGDDVTGRVIAHHRSHGGLSRYEKVPLYLSWAGQVADRATVERYCERFATLVVGGVIAAPWVPGVREYLSSNPNRQRFALVTATPHDEMVAILIALGIHGLFHRCYGAPCRKREAVALTLAEENTPATHAVVVGDSTTDLHAAESNGVPFVLRRTAENANLPTSCRYLVLDDFRGLN